MAVGILPAVFSCEGSYMSTHLSVVMTLVGAP